MFSSSTSTSRERLSPLSSVSRPRSPVSDNGRRSTHSKDTKQKLEDVPQSMKFSSKNTSKSWKVKISTHAAPPEQEERYVRTRERVIDVAQTILGYGSNVAHDVVEISASVLRFAPIGALASAAQTLLIIWSALELVESNQLACLSLTERCADTLLVLREEINEAGENIENQLQFPLMQLNESFNAIKALLQEQAHRPFFKRYLKRRDIQVQIETCDAKLSNALELFSLKIQIRSLQRLEASDAKRKAGELQTRRDLERLLASLPAKIKQPKTLSLSQVITVGGTKPTQENEEALQYSDSEDFKTMRESQRMAPNLSTASDVRELLDDLVLQKNNRDFALDLAELRGLIREALDKSSDEALLDVLQIKREEVPEVLEELHRALEEHKGSNDEAGSESRDINSDIAGKADKEPSIGIVRARTMPLKLHEQEISDELDRSFIECSIKALTRKRTNSV